MLLWQGVVTRMVIALQDERIAATGRCSRRDSARAVSPGHPRGISAAMTTPTDVADKRETASSSQPGLDPKPRDAFTLGEPSRIPYQIKPILRSAAMGLFDGRDPSCSIPSTLTKIGGVVLAVTAVVLAVLGVSGALVLWAFHAAFG